MLLEMSSDEEVFTQASVKRALSSPMTSQSPGTKADLDTSIALSGMSSEFPSSISSCRRKNPDDSPMSTSPSSPSPGRASPPSPYPEGCPKDLNKSVRKVVQRVSRIRIDFLDSNGDKIENSRYSSHPEVIEITSSLIRSTEFNYRSAAVSKLCQSELMGREIKEHVVNKLSKQLAVFIDSDDCPLRNPDLMKEFDQLSEFDFEKVFDDCKTKSDGLMNSLCVMCFGVDMETENDMSRKYIKQRLLAIVAISAFSRCQRVNILQRVLGEFFKLKNTGKQVMQLLHRLGLSLVTHSIRADLDLIGSHFLNETKSRKHEIEMWFTRRKMLEKIISERTLTVKFIDEKHVPNIVELGEDHVKVEKKLDLYQPDKYVHELINLHDNEARAALEVHLDQRPKLFDISYDNIDITVNSNEYLLGQKDNSLHWCSSIVVEDAIDAIEVSDLKHDRSFLRSNFEERIDLTNDEKEHLLSDYEQLLMNLIVANWPSLLPDMKEKRIHHQYSKEFEKEIKIYTGPLVCETESTLEGIAKVIQSLTDDLCPTVLNEDGQNVPVFPTTFSGDQKTEKSARSAQLALLDNGSLRDKLSYIVGRHELLHYMFMLTDVCMDMFADQENIEEASSLSRLLKLLNPRLENKKAKDHFYAFRSMFSDIYLALLGEFLRKFLNVANLEEDATPVSIKVEKNMVKKQKLFKNLIRKLVRSVDDEYAKCLEDAEEVKKLPPFYPHNKFLRKRESCSKPSNENSAQKKSVDENDATEKPDNEKHSKTTKSPKPDLRNIYSRSLFSFLGFYHLLLDSIKEGNGLNCFLIQKKQLKMIHGTGHKNYACSVTSFKHIVLAHPNPQFSHRFMWNIFAGREGKSLKFPRDQKNEHLNLWLKNSFRSLGVNLNEKNAQRINKSADIGVRMEDKVVDFYELDSSGKSHTKKDRSDQIRKVLDILKNEEVANLKPGRKFNGPLNNHFDEAFYRSWHLEKDRELAKIHEIRAKYFS